MNLKLSILATILVFGSFNSFSQTDPQIVKKCNDFEIDGKGSGKEWDKAEWQTFTALMQADPRHETKSKVIYSEKGIYVLFSGQDEKITTKDYKQFGEIYEGDVFEVFFHPKPGLPQYFEYEINHLGKELILTLSRAKGGAVAWAPWDYEYNRRNLIKSKVNISGGKSKIGASITSWTAEIFFPNAIFALMSGTPPQSGDTWNANFCRIDYDTGKPLEWSWSPGIKKSFHELEQFRSIRFE
ncbi:MAG: carbohydrate-binding family 9-like protein [Chitinophagaceae bacterium]|nr:carbohydrate-binding family 9-like protein [Chitinophagaceae bacterium]